MAGIKSYFTPDTPPSPGEVISLCESESRHIVGSLRAKSGSEITLFDGKGSAWSSTLILADKRKAQVSIQHPLPPSPPHKAQITLAQAIPKHKGMESIIQKAVEIGVSHIIPIISDNVEFKLQPDREQKRSQKWLTTAIEAAKQSGNLILPKISPPSPLKEYLPSPPSNSLKLIASLQNIAKPLKSTFTPSHSIHWLIGPEGDFSPQEYSLINQYGFIPTRLGGHVMRVETASIYALSATDAFL